MNGAKKLSVWIFIILYGISYFLQNSVFIDRKKVYAAENPSTTNIVAVFVDKNIYQDIKSDLVRYTTTYIQKKIGNSKAIVLPIDTATLKAHEISQILENMYFEGLKDESSKLVGTILIGDVPLPVVENKGFVYPSIYPYVDFENQQFIYDANKKFFVYNNNVNGQAELRHGIIKFDTISQYNDFFTKVKSYYTNPNTFIDKAIWYEDFIGLKKYFIPENTKYYINSMIFGEDIAYHRFNNLLLNTLKNEHNDASLTLENDLKTDLQNVEDPELKAYALDMESRNNEASGVSQQIVANMPTLTLKKATQEMLKGYDGLISSQFLVKIKNNIAGLARRYKTTEGETFTDYSSLTDKIIQKDNWILGDLDNNVQPLLVQMNDFLESGLNNKIQEEKYYMTIPIPLSQLDFAGKKKGLIQKKCTWQTYNYYENYYFGQDANLISSAEQTNIYKGTFQNLTSLSGQNITNTGQSIGGAYKVFSTQIEANRGYDINSIKEELDRYAKYKTNKQDLRQLKCTKYFLGRKRLNICMKPRSRGVNDKSDGNKCYTGDIAKQGGCESFTGFSARNRGGASPLNLDSTTQKLKNYDYRNAILPIYSIAGSKKIDAVEADADSYKGAITYTTMIQKRFGVGDLQNGSNSVVSLITNPTMNGSDLIFTNQIPVGDLENPTRKYNPPRTYTQTNYFTQFTALPNHILNAGKVVLYNLNAGECGGNGSIYTYKTIDSRVKNISPTRNQISDTEFYKFKDPSDLSIFYTTVMVDLAKTKADITKKTNEFNGTSSGDTTGVVSNLHQLKTIITEYNNSIQLLLGYTPTQIIQSSTGIITNTTIDAAKNLDIINRITATNEGLESLINYMSILNINTVGASFSGSIQSENFKNQKVEILDSWKTNITQNLDYITSNINILKSAFTNARSIYNTMGQFYNNIAGIQAKKTAINGSVLCGTPIPSACGCDANNYKVACDILDNIVANIQTSINDLNDKIDKIHLYQGDNNEYGTPTIVQPFVEINELFTPTSISSEITQTKSTMNTFDVSTDPDKKEKNKGMNLTTQDRPIDNIRNITFQGIGGDRVRLNYPNLYEVEMFTKVDNKLVLKGTGEIREAIKTYLIKKATDYNILLEVQKTKKSQYYQSFSSQFDFLGQLDALANPNTHNYNLLPTDYFINQLVVYLDTLTNSPKYGKKAIYGESKSDTIDDKLAMIAKLLYYQNSTWPEKLLQSSVTEDIATTKESFDINYKISQVTNTYLTEGNDQGEFITPIYNNTGYEVGYINSDGQDYISAKSTPAFIQQIQSAQEKPTNIAIPQLPESSMADLQADVDSCEGVDTQGTVPLFSLKPLSSPWGKAMICWIKKVINKPFDIKISFKNALGPVFLGTTKELMDSVALVTGQRTEYGTQRTVQKNEDSINQSAGDTRKTLQGYNSYAVINIDKAIISVDSTGNSQIKIGMAQDMGKINMKISGTGDNCFGIQSKGKILSSNICTKKAQEFYNPNKEISVFEIVLNKKTSGATALMIELCPPTGSPCIIKHQIINIMPGPVGNIKIQSPDIVMEGSEIPVVVSATDTHGNKIGQSIQAYTIGAGSGDGKIFDGASSNTSKIFDNFAKSQFIYQAPVGIVSDKKIIIKVIPNQTGLLLSGNGSITGQQTAQKEITVVKGIITVLQNNVVLYQNTSAQTLPSKITFGLPKNESDIQYKDADGFLQIKPENVPSLTITVKDTNGKALDTIANIVSKQGMLLPGTMKEKSIVRSSGTIKQTTFSEVNDFVITSGRLDITLYPSFKAGTDIITINIPGIDPINIPVTVNPGQAKTVLLKLNNNRMDLTTKKSSTGTINVVDTRNNKITTGTTIKLGVIGSASSDVSEFIYSGNEYTYTINAKDPGGEGYVFAYIKDRTIGEQVPGYERFIIQESVLPKEKMNIMYLNLFGTDRGNQRGYFSENNDVVNTITNQSNKLLATTTELVDPSKIKQIEYIINPHAQIQSIGNKVATLIVENKEFIALMPEMAKIHLGTTANYQIQKLADSGAANGFGKDTNTILYIPEATDSVITGNEATSSKITINGKDVIDISKGIMDPILTITADNETLADMYTYTLTIRGKTIGKLILRSKDNIIANKANIDLQDPVTYGQTAIFSEGSTNTQGIGIYINTSTFDKQGYESIEDSSDAMLGIGFTSNFKNVSNFANGKSVGEATLPYGSQFLINFGDPLLQRRDKNIEIPNTDFDASNGQTIYADPNRTIFKTVPIDFNKDGLKDLIVVYNDGVIKLSKNYGGTDPYRNMQELMIIAEPIKDIQIGDVDGNGYEDIFIVTNDKGIVYLNDKGIFTVDGKNICLNTNAEPNETNTNPEDFSSIKQLFSQDMDKDGKLDIITNDGLDDIKIFYGGSTNGGANYLSSVTGICDTGRYDRQKNNYKIIKRFGTKINSNRYIQDSSLIHRKDGEIPVEGVVEEQDVLEADGTAGMSQAQMEALKIKTMGDIKTMVEQNDTTVASGKQRLAYTDNPLPTAPVYESLAPDEIKYLPINETNTTVSVYKEYGDINGGVLRQGDEVVIKTTIVSKKSNNKLTYIDQLQGPRSIVKEDTNKIPSLIFGTNNTGGLLIDRNGPAGYQFVIDNIQLNNGETLSFSYTVKYQAQKSSITIDVRDEDLIKQGKRKDGYPDIITNSTDACQKNRWVFFNDKSGTKRTYEQIYDDIQTEINDYNSGAQAGQETAISNIVDQMSKIDSLESLSTLPGMNDLEGWKLNNLLSSLISEGGLSANINFVSNFIDGATAKVSKKLDSTLQGLCQGFSVGEGKGCQGIPVPFNQAFLAPGDYHIFGCVPQLPNPLYPVFRTLNKTIGKGMPLLNIPGNRPTPVPGTYVPAPGFFGYPFKGDTDGFFLGTPGGTRPSRFRLYMAPTLTLGLGMAMCFGPYTVGSALPKPFRDIGGNCIVFALPPLTTCKATSTSGSNIATPNTDSYSQGLVSAAGQGTCNNPPKIGQTEVQTTNGGATTVANTANSPFQIVAAGSSENNPTYSAAIPQGNFGGLISIDQEPMKVSASEDYGNATQQLEDTKNYDGYQLQKGAKIDLKIVGGKAKGLVKCVVQTWMTSQIQYIQNNLTKMTIQLDLPDVSNVFQGFDKIGNLEESYKAINTADKSAGYIQNLSGAGANFTANATGEIARTEKLSKKEISNLSKEIGNNPFEAVQDIFKEIPLINIDTQDLNIKVPALTSEDINKYVHYLTVRVEKNQQIIDDWSGVMLTGNALIDFRENAAGIIRSVKQNIQVLEKYKEFPTQLYEWTHLTDRYLTELSSLLSDFVGGINNFLSVNSTRYSQYVDAITLIIGAIKTWQAIIDFSVNRSEKCSKCSNDNYGSFSCSLSFLCPKLPVLPIPPFKIPNIYMDLSHIELGMNIILPKINFVPIKIPLPQLPNLPEAPTEIQVNIDILKGLSLPTIPVIPEPPTLPEPPSFIPSIKMDLPVLPPAPKIPKILPEINAILKVATFIGKIFCIVKGGIGLVGEKGVKAKIEQITQRTWNVPIFDFFNLTTKFTTPPLQGFDYKLDAYTTLKFNFDGVYDVFNTIAQSANSFVSKKIETPIQKAINQTTEMLNNNTITSGINTIENLNQNININGYVPKSTQETTGMMEYATAYTQLKQGLIQFKNSTNTDKTMNDRVKMILATVENKSNILPATKQIQDVEKAAKAIINKKIDENKQTQKDIQNYDTFIKKIQGNDIVLVDDKTTSVNLKTPLLTIDASTKHILQAQEDPNKTYLNINKKMVQGYLDAVNNDGAEKLNMSDATYTKSKKYLETTKEKIDTALLAYTDKPLIAQTQGTCTNCSTSTETNYSTDISSYVQGVFIGAYSGNTKSMVNTVSSTVQIQSIQQRYTTDIDLNNDKLPDILMYDDNNIYIKYAQQESENFSQGNNSLIRYYTTFYSYENEHPGSWVNPQQRYIQSLDQLRNNTDAYGYITINDITIKVIDKNKEPKNFKTEGETFDNLQLARQNSNFLGESVDGYIIKVSEKIDEKDTPTSFRDIVGMGEKPKYIIMLPEATEYTGAMITIDDGMVKKRISSQLGNNILAVEYYKPTQSRINMIVKNLPRKWLYVSIATLTDTSESLTISQQNSLTLYTKTSPRSNQTVAGMQILGDTTAPVGDVMLRRNLTSETISTGLTHQGYINTNYTLKSFWKDDVIVAKMIIQKDGITILEKDNATQTGTIDLGGLFFTGATQQSYDFIAIDQKNNITKERVTLDIGIPGIEVIDVKKNGETTADIIAKISNDLDEGTVIFQRLRNGLRKDIAGSNQNAYGGFDLSPKQTIITGGIFTIGNTIGLYDTKGNEIATIDPKTGEIKISKGFENTVQTNLSFSTHIPIVELKDRVTKTTLFQIVLPIEGISNIQMNQNKPDYEQLYLTDGNFGDFNGGYCIKNNVNECILYTNTAGAIYIPGAYASTLIGEYIFDTTSKKASFIVKDQANKAIVTLTLQIKASQ